MLYRESGPLLETNRCEAYDAKARVPDVPGKIADRGGAHVGSRSPPDSAIRFSSRGELRLSHRALPAESVERRSYPNILLSVLLSYRHEEQLKSHDFQSCHFERSVAS
jgi:hypothetical protein